MHIPVLVLVHLGIGVQAEWGGEDALLYHATYWNVSEGPCALYIVESQIRVALVRRIARVAPPHFIVLVVEPAIDLARLDL